MKILSRNAKEHILPEPHWCYCMLQKIFGSDNLNETARGRYTRSSKFVWTNVVPLGVGIGQVRPGFDRPEPGLWPIIGRFSWPGLTYLKAWTGLKAYLQTYFILRSSKSSFGLLNKLNMP
ncbi:hypothetical protein MTR_0422s0040 [Medicago truncatula]|uniref:Uncharacterized protein n=1 Tax=Medicago truncatula TaxID=3880 RepID=A0A072TEH6_MEDTR|nr:hypothetical protein MTR_0422s0040 [Medicago truncatula]